MQEGREGEREGGRERQPSAVTVVHFRACLMCGPSKLGNRQRGGGRERGGERGREGRREREGGRERDRGEGETETD